MNTSDCFAQVSLRIAKPIFRDGQIDRLYYSNNYGQILIRKKEKIKKADLAAMLIEDENNFIFPPAVAIRKKIQPPIEKGKLYAKKMPVSKQELLRDIMSV